MLVKKSMQAVIAASSDVAMACRPQAVLKMPGSLVPCPLPVGARHVKLFMLNGFSIQLRPRGTAGETAVVEEEGQRMGI